MYIKRRRQQLGVVAYAINPNTREAETVTLRV